MEKEKIKCPKCGSSDVIEPTEFYPVYTCDPCGADFGKAEMVARVNAKWMSHGVFNKSV